METKFKRDPQLQFEYNNFMNEYLALGHLEQVPVSEAVNISDYASCFLPHHAVFKKDSTTTNLRVVFDGSCHTTNGKSLNDNLFSGPALQQELFSILARFRTHQYVLTADIAKMYRQILVDCDDRNYQLIVWRKRPDLPIETFRLKTVTYGLACSPYLAIRCLHEVAKVNSSQYPTVAEVIERDFYVDDLITGADTVDAAVKMRDQITTLLASSGFDLRKFTSNHPDILPLTDQANVNQTIALDMQNSKTLGVLWNARTDQITFSVDMKGSNQTTKRGVLSMIARLFDPLGLVSPVTITAKITLQEIWKLKINWDESLPLGLHTRWVEFLRTFIELNQIKIPRKVTGSKSYHRIELHGFSDASEKSYGACVYIRIIPTNGPVESNLLCSKNKVAPLKTVSIPRLELSAALLLAKLVAKLKTTLNTTFDQCVYWTDSTIVLSWLQLQPSSLKTFVANRVSQIQSLTDPKEWCHVPSEQNPADIFSRGRTPHQLNQSSLWWQGPQFLNGPEHFSIKNKWNPTSVENSTIPEIKTSCCLLVNAADTDNSLFERFSSFSKLVRVVAYILRFVNNMRTGERNMSRHLSCEELKQAHNCIIKVTQKQAFREDIHFLEKHGKVPQNSKLISLSPFIDDTGLLRVGGRLKNAPLKYDQKHPLLMPKNHSVTNLLIESIHKQQLHGGCQTTIAALRRQYWILSCRNAVRKIIFQCIKCFRANPKSYPQLMGDLPAPRVTPSRPFTVTAIDYAGPIVIKNGYGRTTRTVKSYIAIFVCFATRAVHIELVCDCSTSTFLNALKRFISRGGKPSHLYSDNATNFIGANRELRNLFKQANFNTAIVNHLANEQISWHFIPPRSPHMGGLWEAAVKSTKGHLKRVIGNVILNYEELNTLLTMIEACLNSRPLTPVSNEAADFSALTPGHFLIGDALTSPAEPDLSEIPCNRLNRYQLLMKLRQHFWSRWSKEYLHQLQQRTKWTSTIDHPQENTLVVLREDNVAPLQWPLGRIHAVHPGPDGVIRVFPSKVPAVCLSDQ
jgi:hypothetical protein